MRICFALIALMVLFSSVFPCTAQANEIVQISPTCPNMPLASTDTAEIVFTNPWVVITTLPSHEMVYEIAVLSLQDPSYPYILDDRCPHALFSPDGRYAAVSANGLHILDTTTWQEIPIPALANTSSQTIEGGLLWSSSGRYLAYEDRSILYRLDMETQENVLLLSGQAENPDDADTVIQPAPRAFSPDEQWLVVFGEEWELGNLYVLNAQTGDMILHEEGIGWCGDAHWLPGADATMALACDMMGVDPTSTLYLCDLAGTGECWGTVYPGSIQTWGWTADNQVALTLDRNPDDPNAGPQECYLAAWPAGAWMAVPCDPALFSAPEPAG